MAIDQIMRKPVFNLEALVDQTVLQLEGGSNDVDNSADQTDSGSAKVVAE